MSIHSTNFESLQLKIDKSIVEVSVPFPLTGILMTTSCKYIPLFQDGQCVGQPEFPRRHYHQEKTTLIREHFGIFLGQWNLNCHLHYSPVCRSGLNQHKCSHNIGILNSRIYLFSGSRNEFRFTFEKTPDKKLLCIDIYFCGGHDHFATNRR